MLSAVVRSFVARLWPRRSPETGNLIVHCGGAAGDLMASAEHEWHHADEHKQHSNPEPTEHGGEPPGHEEAHPEHGDPELDREQNQPQEQDPTLFPAGQPAAMEAWLGSSTLSPFLTAERTRARAASSRRSSKASRHSGSRPC